MIFKRLIKVSLLTLAALTIANAYAANVDQQAARSIANSFLKLRSATATMAS